MRKILFVVISLALAACGGGGSPTPSSGSAGGGTTSSVTTPESVAGVVITVSASVPAATAKQVAVIESSVSSGSLGKALALPPAGDQSVDLVIASNAKGEPLLLGFGNTDAALDASTTALALARIAIGMLKPSDGFTLTEIVAAIKTAPDFGAFQSALMSSLAKGTPPVADADVIAKLYLVRRSAQERLTSLIASRVPVAKLAATVVSEINLPAPHYFISTLLGEQLAVDDAVGNGLMLINQTQLYWHAELKNKSGGRIGVIPTMPGLTFAPTSATSSGFSNLLPDALRQLFGTATKDYIVGDASGDYVLTFSQDAVTRRLNAIGVLQKGLFFAIDALIDKSQSNEKAIYECARAIAQDIVDERLTPKKLVDGKLIDIWLEASQGIVYSFIRSQLLGENQGVPLWDKLNLCKIQSPTVFEPVLASRLPGWTNKLLDIWARIEFAADATLVAASFSSWVATYWNSEYSARICKSRGALRPCQISLDLGSVNTALQIGDSVNLIGSAAYGGDKTLALPEQAVWTSSNPDRISVSTTGQINALSAGVATVTLSDPVSASSRSVSFVVSACGTAPVLAPEAHAAARSGTVDQVRDVLCRGWPVNAFIDEELNVMLNAAVEHCSEPKVRVLLEAGSSRAANIWGDTPLRIAQARCGASHPVAVLIANW